MTRYKICIILLLTLLMTGCVSDPKEIIIYKIKKVYIPVPCDVVVTCDFKGTNFEPTVKLLKCVEEQKHALEYCKQKSLEDGT